MSGEVGSPEWAKREAWHEGEVYMDSPDDAPPIPADLGEPLRCFTPDALAAYVAAERAAAVEEALREVRSLAEKWHEHRMAWCRACRDREFAQIHSHDCGMTRRDAEAALRAVLPAAGEGEA